MINVVSKKCIGQEGLCTVLGNEKYDGYCTFCFSNTFPNDPRTPDIKTNSKELQVRDYINQNFDGFIHNKPLWIGCNCEHRRRIDHRKLIGNTLLCIETDKNQHLRYNEQYEKDRINDLYRVHSGKFVFILFNPDKYKNINGIRENPLLRKRFEVLKKEIQKQIKRINNEKNEEFVETIYLYYDKY